MYLNANSSKPFENHSEVNIVCPHCGRIGIFEEVGIVDLLIRTDEANYLLGQRKCPSTSCKGHIFFIQSYVRQKGVNPESLQSCVTYPPIRIDFNKDNIPQTIVDLFSEVLTCHANQCHVAAVIMIRRTLEEICKEQGGTGKNLKDRIQSLKGKIIVPPQLFEAMDELRLLGNDAAHIEAETYAQIGTNEIEAGIELTKELLKALYQYEDLLNRLRQLKANNSGSAEGAGPESESNSE